MHAVLTQNFPIVNRMALFFCAFSNFLTANDGGICIISSILSLLGGFQSHYDLRLIPHLRYLWLAHNTNHFIALWLSTLSSHDSKVYNEN